MALSRNLADFYNEIQNSGGLRYGYQFLVRLAFPEGLWNLGNRGANSGIDNVLAAQYGLSLETLGGLTDPNSGEQLGVDFTFLAKSTALPTMELKNTTVAYFAQSFVFPGIISYGNTWNVTVLLDSKMTIYKQMRLWEEMMSSISRNSGGNKTIPNVRGEIELLDQFGEEPQIKYWVEGIYPTEVPQLDMQYTEGNNKIQDTNIRFAVQYFRQVIPDHEPSEHFQEYFS